MASLLRKTRRAEQSMKVNQREELSTPVDPIRERRKRRGRNLLQEVEERQQPQESPYMSRRIGEGNENRFMQEKDEETVEIDFDKLKNIGPNIAKKLDKLIEEESLVVNDIDNFHDFEKQKAGVLKKITSLMDEKVNEILIKIDKLELDKEKTHNKISELVRNERAKYEITGLIQRKRNILDHIDQLERSLFKSERLKNKIEDFIIFGDLCQNYNEFNNLCKDFMEKNQIFVDFKEEPIVNLSLLHDFLRREAKHEQKYEELHHFDRDMEKHLVDKEYLNYLIIGQKYL